MSFFYFLSSTLFAQDLITLKSGEKIRCRIVVNNLEEKYVTYKVRGEEVVVSGWGKAYKYTEYSKNRNEIAHIEKGSYYAFVKDTVIKEAYEDQDLMILANGDSVICQLNRNDDDFRYVTPVNDRSERRVPKDIIFSYQRNWRRILLGKNDTVITNRKGPEFNYKDVSDIPLFNKQVVRIGVIVGPGFFNINNSKSMIGLYVSGDIAIFPIPFLGFGFTGSYFGYELVKNGYDYSTQLYSYEFLTVFRGPVNEKNTVNIYGYFTLGSQNYTQADSYRSQYSSYDSNYEASYLIGSVGGGLEFLFAKMLAATIEGKAVIVNSSFFSLSAGLRIYIERK